jgi:hypothetical protein
MIAGPWPAIAAVALTVLPLVALAQTPPPPLPALRLPSVQTPGPPAIQTQGVAQAPAPQAPAPTPAPSAAPPAPAPPPQNVWLPKPVAELMALDKVTARATPITVRVGQSATFGSLTITVRACDARPPDQPADATAFLDIADSHAGVAPFHGWMLVSDPSVSMLEHPIYDVRVAGCHE